MTAHDPAAEAFNRMLSTHEDGTPYIALCSLLASTAVGSGNVAFIDRRGRLFAGPNQDQTSKLRSLEARMAEIARLLPMELFADNAKDVDTQRNSPA